MRRWLLPGLLVVAAASVICSAVSICEYSTPRTDIADLSLSFAYDYHRDPYGIANEDVSTGRLDVVYSRLFDSADVGYNLDVTNYISVAVPEPPDYSILARGSLKRYVHSGVGEGFPVFGFAGITGRSAASYETIGLVMNLGVGYGRFTDVTPLAKAVQVDQALVRGGALEGHLSDPELISLAHDIDSAATYPTTAELLRAIEDRVLRQSGLLRAGGLDALASSEVERILTDDRFVRYCGGEFKVGLEYELIDPLLGANNLLANIGFNYAFTTTPQTQFLLEGSLAGAYEVWRGHRIEFAAQYNRVLAEQVAVEVGYAFARERFADRLGNVGDATWRHDVVLQLNLVPAYGTWVALEATFRLEPFFLEWAADITLSIGVDLI